MRIHENRKNVWVDGLSVGKQYENFIGGIKNVRNEESKCCFTLFDKTGEIEAEMPKGKGTISHVNGIVYVTDIAICMLKGHKTAVLRSIRFAESEKDLYNPMDIFQGISVEAAEKFKQHIRLAVQYVIDTENAQHITDGYGKLLSLYYTDEELKLLAEKPGSVNDNARYAGGALVTVCTVTYMAKDICREYTRFDNGLYQQKIDYILLVSACLLCMCGMTAYVGDDLNKTRKGYARGYYSLMQTRLEELFAASGISEERADKLLNTLHCMFPGAGAIKSVTFESSICRSVFLMFSEMDRVADFLSQSPTEDELERGLRYSPELERPFLVAERKKIENMEDSDEKDDIRRKVS